MTRNLYPAYRVGSRKEKLNLDNPTRAERTAILREKHGTKTFRKTQRILKDLRGKR